MNILAIDPGSTSTKIGILRQGKITKSTITHKREFINSFKTIAEQQDFRYNIIESFLKENGYENLKFDAVVGRGGLLKPLQSGTYIVNKKMLQDLEKGINGHHASNLGGILSYKFAEKFLCTAYIVNPVIVDEMEDVAKISGFKEITRKSIFHALNQKAVARKAADKIGKDYNEINLIVAHMGGGISIGLHKKGKVADVNNALDGDGPFGIERTGSLPVGDLVKLIKNKKYTEDELLKIFSSKGGTYSYLNTTDMIEVEKKANLGNIEFNLILEGFIYQISKEIGSLAAAANGKIDSIVLTGGVANSKTITEKIKNKVQFISPVLVFAGEFELEALIKGAMRVLNNNETHKEYK